MSRLPVSEDKRKLLEEAFIKLKYVDREAAEYAGVSPKTAQRYRVNVFKLGPNSELSAEKKRLILEAHKLGHYIKKAAEYAGVSQTTVLNYWKNNSLKVHYTDRKFSQEKIAKILEGHKLGYSTTETARYAGTNQPTVCAYWKKEGLKAHGKNNEESKVSQEKLEKILEAHKLRYSIIKAAEHAGVSQPTVLNYWKKNGLKAHGKMGVKNISKESIEKILEAHKLNFSLEKAAEYAGVSQTTVFNYWKEHDLKTHGKNNEESKVSQEKIDKILEGHKLEYSLLKTAEYAGVSQGTVYRYWKDNALKAHGSNHHEKSKNSNKNPEQGLEAIVK
jgi:predicted transcriptional regulator